MSGYTGVTGPTGVSYTDHQNHQYIYGPTGPTGTPEPIGFITTNILELIMDDRTIQFPRDFINLEEQVKVLNATVADLVSRIDELQSQIYELYVPNGSGALQTERSFTSTIESQSLDND